jgi:hypothetical protein
MSDVPDEKTLRKRVTKASWRAKAGVRTRGLRTSAMLAAVRHNMTLDTNDAIQNSHGQEKLRHIYDCVREHAADAEHYITQRTRALSWLNGSLVEATWASIHEGDVQLVGLLPDDQLLGRMPSAISMIQTCLPSDDPRRAALEKWWDSRCDASNTAAPPRRFWRRTDHEAIPPRTLTDEHRELISAALRAAYQVVDNDHSSVRSFRNILLGAVLTIGVLLVGLGLIGAARPGVIPLCVTPTATTAQTGSTSPARVICPTGERDATATGQGRGDVLVVELLGLVGAALAGVVALSGSQQVEIPYSLTVAQALLKATAGATTAVLGVMFFSAGILPNVGAMPSQASILTYAALFGYGQQLFTRVIDQRADAVLQAASPTAPAPTNAAVGAVTKRT